MIVGLSIDEVKKEFGKGWNGLIERYFRGLEHISQLDEINVESAHYRNGMMFVWATCKNEDKDLQNFLNMLTWQTERKSIKCCEHCGKWDYSYKLVEQIGSTTGRGYRRKDLPGKPVRCFDCYVELANEMADKGEI